MAKSWPYWSTCHHARTWFEHRQLDNLLFVHFADLLADPRGEIARMAAFLGIELSEAELTRVVEATSFASMKDRAESVVGDAAGLWKGGARQFLHKGTNGRWRGVLRDDELAQYHALVERELTPECARWLEQGRASLVGAAHP